MIVETEEIRQKMLAIGGTILTFDGFTILGYMGFSISRLYDGESSVYNVENPTYTVMVTTADCFLNEIVDGFEFTLTDGTYTYSCILNNRPSNLMDGWSKLSLDYIGKV